MQQPYFLASHIHVCGIGDDIVVLDLKQDRYLSFDREFWDPIARAIGGWPADAASADATPDEVALGELLESGLLTTDRNRGKDAAPAALELPETSMVEDFRAQRPRIRASHLIIFLTAIATAFLRLRLQSLETIVTAMRRRREQHDKPIDVAQMRELTEIFRRVRPLLFTSHNHCLFESLTLLQFLAHYRIHPTWVFGVQTAPFIAHCWLQHEDIACNEILDRIRRCTPIMLA